MNHGKAPDTQASSPQANPRRGMSLRAKGFWMLVFFVVFTFLTGLVVVREHAELYSNMQQLQAIHMEEEYQIGLNMHVANAVLALNENTYNQDMARAAHLVAQEIEAVNSSLQVAAQFRPGLVDNVTGLKAIQARLANQPTHETLTGARAALDHLVDELGDITQEMRIREIQLLQQYNSSFDRLSLEWSLIAAISAMLLGGLVMIFVTRLAWDIRRVQDRAMEIVNGYRGEPLAVTRQDELGSLMEAINSMQQELRQRETQAELSRQQQFHKDKMAAVGAMAAAVAHEINNPLAAISGLSQSMTERRSAHRCGMDSSQCHPEMLIEQARRVMEITRQISEFSVPQSAEPELLDLNSLIRNTAKFVSFDRRFRQVDMVHNLDPQLPAVDAVADHLTQIVMNLMINAADAMENQTNPRPRIILSTQQRESGVVVTVADNGSGMSQETLARVFEEYFTTKPPGKGSGIGLAVSKSLIESMGGSISIESAPGMGTTVTLQLPVAPIETAH